MESLAIVLAVLAVLLALVVPGILFSSGLGIRAPRTVMVLWQAIALAGGLSLIGAPLLLGLAPFGSNLPQALGTMWELLQAEDFAALETLDVHPINIFALCLAVLLGFHLILTLVLTYFRVRSARQKHRELVDLLSTNSAGTAEPAEGEATHVLEYDTPVAYCLPGGVGDRRPMTVVSRGLMEQLSDNERGAVITHEQTHLHQRHHLLTMSFEAWYKALPWLPTTRHGRNAVLALTEMMADDGALALYSRKELLRALMLSAPRETEGVTSPSTQPDAQAAAAPILRGPRLQRLLEPPTPIGLTGRILIITAAAALFFLPTAMLFLA